MNASVSARLCAVPKGKCRLCLTDNANLQNSHLTPAGVYRLLDSPHSPNPNPILIATGITVATAREIRGYVLCRSCEEVLSREGENWVLPRLATRDKTSVLHDIVIATTPDLTTPNGSFYATASNPKMRTQDLTHFALGVFWKASVYDWRTGSRSTSWIDFGPYGDGMRPFLLRSGPFPANVALAVVVMPPPKTTRMLSYIPREVGRSNGAHCFGYYVPGVLFMLSVGKRVSQDTRDWCFYRNPLHPIWVQDLYEEIEGQSGRAYLKAQAAMGARTLHKKGGQKE
jgi:hypothetical protein